MMRAFFMLLILLLETAFGEQATRIEGNEGSYTLYSIGFQTAGYSESYSNSASDQEIISQVYTTSPFFLLNSHTHVNDTHSFEIISASTFFAIDASESYLLDGKTIEQHQLNYNLLELGFRWITTFVPKHSIVYGLDYDYERYKRFNFESGVITERQTTLVEHSVSTLSALVGYRYNSHVGIENHGSHLRISGDIGLPLGVLRNATFSSDRYAKYGISGFVAKANIYYGFKFINGMELGAYMDGMMRYRSEDFKFTAVRKDEIWNLDASVLFRIHYGLALSWNYELWNTVREVLQ